MRRAGWLGVLIVSVCLAVAAVVGIAAASESGDAGNIDVSRDGPKNGGSASGPDQAEKAAATYSTTVNTGRAGAAPTVPSVARAEASLNSTEQPDSRPVRLRVADVELDAPLDATGVRDDGLMAIPDDGKRAGWYRFGPAPGDGLGSVVVAGHVDTKAGWGAMAALRDVPIDTLVEVEMADGSTYAYRVVGRETIAKDDLLTGRIFDRDGPERLTLITCGGPWRAEASSYRDNVVVVATPVDQR